MSRRKSWTWLSGALAAGSWFVVAPASAQTRPITELDAVTLAVTHNPSLHVALLQAVQARYGVQAEEGLFSPVFSASGAYTRSRTPTLLGGVSEEGDVGVGTTETFELGSGIRKTFTWGTTLSLDVAGSRTTRSSAASEALGGGATGPLYGIAGTLSLTQPFLRGAGNAVGLSSLRQARWNQSVNELGAQQSASNLLRDVLRSYWELWYSSEAIRINRASLDLAVLREQQAQQQVASGALAPADALPYATQVAELTEAVVLAQTDSRQRELALGQLLAEPGRGTDSFVASDAPAARDEDVSEAAALEEAMRASYQRKQLAIQIEQNRDLLRIAGDALRPRLDLDAYLQVQGLGNERVPPAFEQAGKMEALSAHVGLTFETPIDDSRREAQVQSATLNQHIAQKQLEALEVSLRSSVASALAQERAAVERLRLAQQTEQVARQQAEAERARFTAGSSIAIQVQQAEDSLRLAELRVQRAKVDLSLAAVELDNLRGRLLTHYGAVIDRLAPSTRATLQKPVPVNF